MTILVTGTAGFIGAAVAKRLLDRGDTVVGIDNFNPYYDVDLKRARLQSLTSAPGFHFVEGNLADRKIVDSLFTTHRPSRVIHLAAQAGVRFSLQEPFAYTESNIQGFLTVLEGCRHHQVEHLVYASSSSVYGANRAVPFSTRHNVDHPVSLYAATKKANELMAHSYSHLFQMPVTGLRFFTVYGPWGRPDMAYFSFTQKILAGEPIEVYNFGKHSRDFTYIDDITEAVLRVVDKPATPNPDWRGERPDPATSNAPYRVYNLGNSSPVALTDFIAELEKALGKKAQKKLLPMQPGDVVETYADMNDFSRQFDFRPRTALSVGVPRFVEWYLGRYGTRRAA